MGGVICSDTELYGQFGPVVQNNCSPYEFRIKKINPTLTNQSGAFNAKYEIYFASKTNNVLPQSISLNYLAFAGKINVNGFTSRINEVETQTISQGLGNGNFYPLLTTNAETGEVTWTLGQYQSCANLDPQNPQDDAMLQLHSAIGTINTVPTEVHLFTIVVTGAPNETIDWVEKSGTYSDCTVDCNSDMEVVSNGSLDVTFPSFTSCNPAQNLEFFYAYQGGDHQIRVSLDVLTLQTYNRIDGQIRLNVMGNGIPDIDFRPLNVGAVNVPIFTYKKQKNPDGSWDIYYSLTNLWTPQTTGNIQLFSIEVQGQTNLSQGAMINCTQIFSRSVLSAPTGSVLCAFSSTPTDVVIPGYGPCMNKLTLRTVQTFDNDCNVNLRFSTTMFGFNPMNFESVKIELLFNVDNPVASAPSFTTNLPGTASSGLLTQLSSESWSYVYEVSSPVTIEFDDYIDVQFPITSQCVKYYVIRAEGVQQAQTSPCAWGSKNEAGNWPACSPEIAGQVIRPGFNFDLAPEVRLTVRSASDPNYSINSDLSCGGAYSFCPDQDFKPFVLQASHIETNGSIHCDCGVDAYDLVLISRHLLSLEPLTQPYGMIAANAVEELMPNTSEKISPEDILGIRFCILGQTNNFHPKSSPSWRYFSDTYNFPTGVDPLSLHPYVGSDISQIPTPNIPGPHTIFNALKMGDVNHSCFCSQKTSDEEQVVKVEYSRERNGQPVRASFKTTNDAAIAQQWAFRYNPNEFSVKSIIPNTASGVTEDCFGTSEMEAGIIRFLWFNANPDDALPTNSELFSVELEPKTSAANTNWPDIQLAQDKMVCKSFAEETEYKVNLSSLQPQQPMSLIVQPNPVQDVAQLYIESQEASSAVVRVENAVGLVLFEQPVTLQKGSNNYQIYLPNIVPGQYFIGIQSEKGQVRRTLIKSAQ